MFSGLAWVGSRNPHPFFWGRGDRASCFLMPWPHGGIRDSIWLCHFSPLEVLLSSCPSQQGGCRWLAGEPCCKWQLQGGFGHGCQVAEVEWKHYRIFIIHCGSVFMAKQRGHQLNTEKKKNWIHFLQSLTDALPLPESGTSKTKLETHWLFQLWPILPGLYILSQRNWITILPLLLTPTIYGVHTRCQTPPPITLIWISPPNTLMK